MGNNLMSSVFAHGEYVWINIPKCASSFFREKVIKKIQKESSHCFWLPWAPGISDWEVKKAFQKYANDCDSKLTLLLHVRDPWERFKASVREDYKKKYKEMNVDSLHDFCMNVERNYGDFDFGNPEKSLGLAQYGGWILLYLKMADRVFNVLHLLGDHIDTIELWQFECVHRSIKEKFGFECDPNKTNDHPRWLVDAVDDFFNNKTHFIKQWRDLNLNDIRLYDLTNGDASVALSVRDFTGLFFKKDDPPRWGGR